MEEMWPLVPSLWAFQELPSTWRGLRWPGPGRQGRCAQVGGKWPLEGAWALALASCGVGLQLIFPHLPPHSLAHLLSLLQPLTESQRVSLYIPFPPLPTPHLLLTKQTLLWEMFLSPSSALNEGPVSSPRVTPAMALSYRPSLVCGRCGEG